MEEKQTYLEQGLEAILNFAPKLVGAIAVLVIGFWLVKKIIGLIEVTLKRSTLNHEVSSFILSLVNAGAKVMILLVAAGMVGFDTTSLVAVLAAAGFAVGMALQGGLGNFASGILILVFKPYKVGDWIEVEEKFGKVQEIQIFNTIMETPGRKTLIIPNGMITDNIVTNYSEKGFIRMELNVTMPYEEDFPRVKTIIEKALIDIPGILKDPTPEIGIETYDSHSIILAVRPYVEPDDFWEVTFDAHRKIKEAFNANGIRVAYSEGVELGPIGG